MKIGAKLCILAGAACFLAIALGTWSAAMGGTINNRLEAPGKGSRTAEVSVLAVSTAANDLTAATNALPASTVTSNPIADANSLAAPASASEEKQADFLGAIGVPEAWKLLGSYGDNVMGTIAVVDTGVDLKHPGLTPYLTGGVNLLDAKKPPQDDNGHGTAVAGIIAEIADAAKQVPGGAAWQMKIMPVKALDRNGEGDEKNLAAGIRYAVQHGANIVVLSLGLRRDTPEMRDVVALAESKGVLLVAASGNDGAEFGTKAAVQYPAAYPTVLAVAGSDGDNAQSRSTSGSEVDVAAPWRVETLKLGGGMTTMEGSSMSAPQAAGAAALLLARHPAWTPAELRETLRRTASDTALKGWDRYTGYGRVRADLAVQAEAAADWREPDENRLTAKVFPLGGELLASWSRASDVDGYLVDVPYDGKLTVSWKIDDSASASGTLKPSLQLFPAATSQEVAPTAQAQASSIAWPVKKGQYYLRTSRGQWGDERIAAGYRLESSFAMASDAMEPNQSAKAAYVLEPRSQKWTGTFSSQGDEDWFVVNLPTSGKLRIRVDTDTTRIDPAILLMPAGEAGEETDEYADGKSEEVVVSEAAAGKYYIRIRNAVSSNPAPVIGTYAVQLEYSNPDDSAASFSDIAGHWAKPQILAVANAGWMSGYGNGLFRPERPLTRAEAIAIAVRAFQPDGGASGSLRFTDIKRSSWAYNSILEADGVNWLSGYTGPKLEPNRQVTRGEAAILLAKAAGLSIPAKPKPAFTDVPAAHPAAGSLEALARKGWIHGFADGSFRPAKLISRSEWAVMLAQLL